MSRCLASLFRFRARAEEPGLAPERRDQISKQYGLLKAKAPLEPRRASIEIGDRAVGAIANRDAL